MLKCKECLTTMETREELLPEDFYHHCLTDIKTNGGSKYNTPEMFEFFHAVETVYKTEVNQNNLNIWKLVSKSDVQIVERKNHYWILMQ